MNTAKIAVTLVLLVFSVSAPAQMVFSVQYENQADVKVYVVKYENQAGWRNKEKIHLMYQTEGRDFRKSCQPGYWRNASGSGLSLSILISNNSNSKQENDHL